MVGLVVGQVHLQQFQIGVDRLGQPQPGDQPVQAAIPPKQVASTFAPTS